MIWTAALYFAASPRAESIDPACGRGAVWQADSRATPATTTISLEDMAILLLEADRFGGGHSARLARRRGRRRRHDPDLDVGGRNSGRSRARRHAGVGPAGAEQVE